MPSLKRFRFGCVRISAIILPAATAVVVGLLTPGLFTAELMASTYPDRVAIGSAPPVMDSTHEIEANDREWQDFIYAVRSGFIAGHDSSTIGKAFERHFAHPSWHATQKKDGSMLVVFLGGIPVADTTGTSLESYSNLTLLVFFKFTKGEKTFNFVDMRLGYRDDLLALPTETQQNLLRMAYGGR